MRRFCRLRRVDCVPQGHAPKGPFFSVLRLYWPKPAAIDGKWKAPPLQRLTKIDDERRKSMKKALVVCLSSFCQLLLRKRRRRRRQSPSARIILCGRDGISISVG